MADDTTTKHSRAVAITSALVAASFASSYVLRFASSMVLTRKLDPSAFGVVSMVGALMMALHLFSDIGVGPALIRSPRGDDPTFVNTAWTLQVVRGLALSIVGVLLAWPVAKLYGQPILAPVLVVVALSEGALGSLASTGVYSLTRRMSQGRIIALNISTSLVSLVATLGWIYVVGSSVWALVVGGLIANLYSVALSHMLTPEVRNRFCWDRTALRELSTFGRWIFLSTIFCFLGYQSERLLLPSLAGFASLGVYGVAQSVVAVAAGLLTALSQRVLFPLCTRMLRDGASVATVYAKVHRLSGLSSGFLITGVLSAGPLAVEAAYPAKFHDAAIFVDFIAVTAWIGTLHGPRGLMLIATGDSRSDFFTGVAKTVGMVLLVPAAAWLGSKVQGPQLWGVLPWRGSMTGVLVGGALSEAVTYVFRLIYGRRLGIGRFKEDVILTLLVAVVATASHRFGTWSAAALSAGVGNAKIEQLVRLACVCSFVVVFWGSLVAAWRVRQLLVSPGKARTLRALAGMG